MTTDSIRELADVIRSVDRVTVLTHAHPDGDTIGAGFALTYGLRKMGKLANVKNSDCFPDKFSYIFEGYRDEDFEEQTVISVDVADTKLLGQPLESYSDRIDICIDHHGSNRLFAKKNFIDGSCCAVCLMIFRLLQELNVEIDPLIANCLYTGIATDTGCFMYENTSPDAHVAAAELILLGARIEPINRKMFQIKSKGRLLSEQQVIGGMRFDSTNSIALICITNEIIDKYGVDRADLDAFAGIPLTVEGVRIGITLKQQAEDPEAFRASVRTLDTDASALASEFGGGGHKRAAGCTVRGSADEVANRLINVARRYL